MKKKREPMLAKIINSTYGKNQKSKCQEIIKEYRQLFLENKISKYQYLALVNIVSNQRRINARFKSIIRVFK